MRCSSITVVILLLAGSAAAENFYLPIGGPIGGRSSRTELRIVNTSASRTNVAIEFLENTEGSSARTTQITLDAGQTVRWSDAVAELFHCEGLGALGIGALRIGAEASLRVTAVSHCASCGTTSSVPVLDDRHASEEGTVRAGVGPNDLAWRSGVVIVNPAAAPVLVTLNVHRGDALIDESAVEVPARGMRGVSMDRHFRSERESEDRVTFSAPGRVLLFGYDFNELSGARVFTPPISEAGFRRRRAVRFTTSLPPAPQTVVLTPSKDNTLYESSNGALSNGAGVHLFAGATGSGSLRRTLLAFDVASQIPPGSRITRATLTLQVSLTIAAPQPVELRRVNTDWGQGTSNAGSSRDGGGAASQPGDATWIHTFFPDRFWNTPGGDRSTAIDATTLAGAFGPFTWDSSIPIIARVQEWLDQPATNFGWLLIGNEATDTTAKRFDSREGIPATRPALTVEFVR